MDRIRNLNRYQKGVLLLTVIMALSFTAAYFVTTARVGFAYRDAILLPEEEDGTTLYSGKIRGVPAVFRVFPDKKVEFQYGEKRYGPYTAREDPTAVPESMTPGIRVTGVELREGEKILFRGGVAKGDGFYWLYDEDGSLSNMTVEIYAVSEYGTVYDENGEEVDPMEPSASTILSLMAGPELSHKGDWYGWFLGMLVCAAAWIAVLFAEELFRLSMSFRVQDPYQVEPSDWEVAGRYIGWTALVILALVVFAMGLQ